MDAITFYRIIFVGNEPYKNDMDRRVNQLDAELQDEYWSILMLNDLFESIKYYVRKFILGVFKILIFKIS